MIEQKDRLHVRPIFFNETLILRGFIPDDFCGMMSVEAIVYAYDSHL